MACLSPSPSGRRLSELLEEQQEPFSLDLHLLEKGCSPTLLDGYDTTALCWPAAAGNDAALVLRRLTSRKKSAKKKKKPAARGLLQLLLSKILRGSSKPAALQCSESFKMAAAAAAVAPSPPCPDKVRPPQEEGPEPERYSSSSSDSDESDDEKQQLSPVSVLEAHPFEFEASPAHAKLMSPSKNAAMDVFRELLDAAYSPALLTQLLAKTDDLLLSSRDATAADDDEDDCFYGNSSCRTSPRSCREDESAAAYWDAHRAELARVSELVASEVPASRIETADVQPERRDVGAELEAAVLESLVRELVEDLGTWRC